MIRRLFALLFLCFLSLWGIFQLQWTQNAVRATITSVAQKSGLAVSYEHLEFNAPFCFRLTNLLITSDTGETVASCQDLSFSPLLIDLPWHRCTILYLNAKGLYINSNSLSKEPLVQNDWSFSILHFSLPSLSYSGESFSVSGRAAINTKADQASCDIQVKRQSWPKKWSFSAEKKGSSLAFEGSCALQGAVSDLLFGPKDFLSFCGDCTLNQSSSKPIQKAFCKWAVASRQLRHRLPREIVLEHMITGKGSLSYDEKGVLRGTIDKSQILIALKKPTVNNALTCLKRHKVSLQGLFTATKTQNDSIRMEASLSSCSLNNAAGSLSASAEIGPEKQINALFSGNISTPRLSAPLHGTLSGKIGLATLTLTSPSCTASIHLQNEDTEQSIIANIRGFDLSFLNDNLRGDAELFAQLALKGDKAPLSIMLRTADLAYMETHLQDGTFSLSSTDFLKDPSIVRCDLTGLRYKDLSLARAHSLMRYTRQQTDDENSDHPFPNMPIKKSIQHHLAIEEICLLGKHGRLPFNITASGSSSQTSASFSLFIDSLQGTVENEDLQLIQPLQIDLKKSTLSRASASIRLGEKCRITAKWQQPSFSTALSELSVEHFPLSLIPSAFNTHSCSGTLSGFLAYKKTTTDVRAKMHLEASKVRYGVIGAEGSEVALGMDASIVDDSLFASLCAAGVGIKDPLYVEGKTSILRTRQGPLFSIEPASPIQAVVRGSLNISEFLTSWIPKSVHIEGTILGDLSVKGTLNNPSFQGPVSVRRGRIEIPATAQVLNNIEMNGRALGRTITVDTIHAQDEKEGTLEGTGTLGVDDKGRFSWQTDLLCSKMEVVSLAYAKASANGTVRLEGDSSTLQISGDALSKNAVVNLAARFPESLPDMQISYKDEAPPLTDPYTVTLHIGVDGQEGLTIKGKGLSSLWKGAVRIDGEASSLQMKGTLRCTEGSFMLGSRELLITEGTIGVNGNLFSDSKLHIIATINLPSTIASVCLSGSLASPKLSIQSTPMKPEHELLSLILFNKEFGDISPFESLQLAQTALQLRQTKGPLDFINRMKESLGIDVLDVNSQPSTPTSTALDPSDTADSSQAQNDVSLRVGKYLSQGVAVVVSKDVTSDTNRLGIEAHVAQDITAAAEIGDDETSVVSLKWKKDY